MREALAALDLVVVIDVAMTETARLADYVLPVPTQFEKFEATFFNFDFPRNVFHLRHPVLDPPDGVLPEPEIHARPAPGADAEWPFVLSAGERRAFTANTIIRDPRWRKRDGQGALRISDADATRLGITVGDTVRLSTRRGTAEVAVEPTPRMRPGHIALPNGLGLIVHDVDGARAVGVAPNELTAAEDRDQWAGTPWLALLHRPHHGSGGIKPR
jgi:anaerobic selenocysteine-containing dehydrogenase